MTVDAIVKARYIEYFHLVIEIVDTVVMVSAVWYLKTLLVSMKLVDYSTFIKKKKIINKNSGCCCNGISRMVSQNSLYSVKLVDYSTFIKKKKKE